MNASGRRQRQARNNFNHLAPRQRPNYKRRDKESSAAREAHYRKMDADRRARGYKGK